MPPTRAEPNHSRTHEPIASRQRAPVPHPRDAPLRGLSGAEDLAVILAHMLDDMAGLPYYMKLSRHWIAGRILPRHDRMAVARVLMDKANDLAAARRPYGPIRNPAAAFVAWAKTLDRG